MAYYRALMSLTMHFELDDPGDPPDAAIEADSRRRAEAIASLAAERVPEHDLIATNVERYWKIGSHQVVRLTWEQPDRRQEVTVEAFERLLLRFATDWRAGGGMDAPNAEMSWVPGPYALKFTPQLCFADAWLFIRTARTQWNVDEIMEVQAGGDSKLAEKNGQRARIVDVSETNLPVQTYTLRFPDDEHIWIAEEDDLRYTGLVFDENAEGGVRPIDG